MITVGNANHSPAMGPFDESQELRIASESMPFLVRQTQTSVLARMLRLPRFLYRGYSRNQAGDLAAQIAYHALIAMVPIFFLLVGVGGLFLRNDTVMNAAIDVIHAVFPTGSSSADAFRAALEVRQASSLLSLLSFISFAWVGTGWISSMARAMNKIYGTRNASFIVEKQRGFMVIMLFLLFFVLAILSSIVPTLLLLLDLPESLDKIVLNTRTTQLIAYGVAVVSTLGLFLVIYRIVPNARQTLGDVWPGTILATVLFLAMTQVFPIYIRMVGGVNRYGRLLGLISLLVAALYFLAQIILFGCFINATWRRDRLRRKQQKALLTSQ